MPFSRYTSREDRAKLFLAQNGRCKCGVRLHKGNTIIEHSTPLALGGLDVITNKYLNCRECANLKTYGHSKATSLGSDIHAIAKTKRLRGETKTKRSIVPGSRGSKWKRKMDGTVVER